MSLIDLTGKRFGRLTVLGRNNNYQKEHNAHHPYWDCICDCGNKCVISGPSLRTGNTKSCGCYQKEMTSKASKKKNIYDFGHSDYVIGYATNGGMFKVDREDYSVIRDYCWCINPNGYLVAWDSQTKKLIYLHRLLTKPAPGLVVDHINGDRTDNRRINLRMCSQQNNSRNRNLSSNSSTGVCGIRYYPEMDLWGAYIFVDGKQIYLGSYQNKEDAVNARMEAEDNYFGEYSYANSRKLVQT